MGVYKLSASGGVKTGRTNYPSMLAGNETFSPSSFDLISSTVLSSSQSSISFDVSSLASTYKHLQLRISARSDRTSSGGDYIRLRFNSDSGSNYSYHTFVGNGGSLISEAATSTTGMHLERIGSSDLSTGNFGVMIVDILSPFSTSKFKTVKNLGGVSTNFAMLQSGSWRSNSAVTAVNVVVGGGSNFISGSRFSLYGIKG